MGVAGSHWGSHLGGGPWIGGKHDPWRIIPGLGSVVNNLGDPKSPKDRVVGPLMNGRTPWLISGGDPNH